MIATDRAGLFLTPFSGKDAAALHALMQANRDHLTAHGDFREQLALSISELRSELEHTSAGHHRFGIFLNGELIGRIDLNAVEPPRYGLGYWLAAGATGRGYAGASLRAVCSLAESIGATDLYAGVTHGNARSVALLERAGFSVVERFERYTRFHLAFEAA